MITRTPDWPDLLSSFIEGRRNSPFEWGKNDCCLFASDWVYLCTGVDPALGIRGTYNSALSAARILQDNGGITAMVKLLGLSSVPIGFSKRGDLAVKDFGDGETIGIVIGSVAAFTGKDALIFCSTEEAICWRL